MDFIYILIIEEKKEDRFRILKRKRMRRNEKEEEKEEEEKEDKGETEGKREREREGEKLLPFLRTVLQKRRKRLTLTNLEMGTKFLLHPNIYKTSSKIWPVLIGCRGN